MNNQLSRWTCPICGEENASDLDLLDSGTVLMCVSNHKVVVTLGKRHYTDKSILDFENKAGGLAKAVESWFVGPPAWANREREILDMAHSLLKINTLERSEVEPIEMCTDLPVGGSDPVTAPAELAACAHLRVGWRTERCDGTNIRGEVVPNGALRGWWECDSGCGTRFVAADALKRSEAGLEMVRAELGLSDVARIFALADCKGLREKWQAAKDELTELRAKFEHLPFNPLTFKHHDVDEFYREELEPIQWRCTSCGESFLRETFSHAVHYSGCDGSCSKGMCPVECGPVEPVFPEESI